MPILASPDSTPQLAVSPLRVLIVEDDRTMEPLWSYILEAAVPEASVEWVTNGEAALRVLNSRFDLIIADIFLGGQTTGLDLWESLGDDSQCAFILMSVITPQRLSILAQNARRPLPSYLQKPLDPNQCIETVRALLKAR